MIENERDIRTANVIEAGRRMLTAARTAPKAKGLDMLECCLVIGEDIDRLADEMMKLYGETSRNVFKRDSANIRKAQCVVIIATQKGVMGLDCGHCGYRTCTEKPENVPCAFNSIDVGIAVGSACATAADLRVDTRVMYSVGMAAERLKLLGAGTYQYIAIPVSASSKSPFFDR